MADRHTKEQRSYNMSRIPSVNTKPEIMLKNVLKGTYLRFQPKIYGKPDFGNKSRKIVVFIDGCFWHKCPKCYIEPKSNRKFWITKIKRNVKRDRIITKELRKQGYNVIRVWEHQAKKDISKCAEKIHRETKKRR